MALFFVRKAPSTIVEHRNLTKMSPIASMVTLDSIKGKRTIDKVFAVISEKSKQRTTSFNYVCATISFVSMCKDYRLSYSLRALGKILLSPPLEIRLQLCSPIELLTATQLAC